jgi:hypothetical protein
MPLPRAACWLAPLVLAAAVPVRPVGAATVLHLGARTRFAATPVLRLAVISAGSEAATHVVPEVAYHHDTYQGAPAQIAPGSRRDWRFSLSPPAAPGTYAVTIRVRYRDARGDQRTIPTVALLSTPGAAPGAVSASLSATPTTSVSTVRLVLDNRGPRPVAGRVTTVLPSELHTEPETSPVELPVGASRLVPVNLMWRDPSADELRPVWVLFEYRQAGVFHAIAARVDVARPPDTWRRRVPLVVVTVALVSALAILGIAWRSVAARATREPFTGRHADP